MDVMAEITKTQLIDRERASWAELVKCMEFFGEMLSAKTDKVLVKDASTKMTSALSKYKGVLKQRLVVEFGKP